MKNDPRTHRTRDRLRDLTGSLRLIPHRPDPHEYEHLLQDDGHLDRDEQIKIFETLLPAQNRASYVRFFLMLTLSVTIAVMGLAANSAAVVIGAMLVAPLMNPIMTFSAAVGLGLGKRAVRASFMVVAGSIWCVVYSIIASVLLPTVEIGTEVLSRTRPDVRDLIVAIAAGAAGAYATARKDVSSALPGVAVAVALVPPLAATGILIGAKRMVDAEGSALLYLTNLLAISVSALVVLVLTNVIPTVWLLFRSPRITLTAAAILLCTVAIAVPLTQRSLQAASTSKQSESIQKVVQGWIGSLDLEPTRIDVEGATVKLELSGPDKPPEAYELAKLLEPIFGAKAEAIVKWDQRALGRGRADTPPVADPVTVSRGVIQGWLDGLKQQNIQLRIVELKYQNNTLDVEVTGPVSPPSTPSLSDQVAQAIGADVELHIRWIQSFDQTLGGVPPTTQAERIITAWIGSRTSVRPLAVSVDSRTAIIDLGTSGIPLGIENLRSSIVASVNGIDQVEIRLTPLTPYGKRTVKPSPPEMS